ncbi:MAG: IreB family regulatory phosphoprotein [Bacillota bacterium]|jgi:uncharacterized protein (UPF0297 family)
MNHKLDPTMEFVGNRDDASVTIQAVYDALKEKGYAASNQIVGYLISGDPSYITSYKDARNVIQSIERDELMDIFVSYYLEHVCE